MNQPTTITSKLKSFRYNKRYTPPLLITVILLGAHLSFGILESYGRLLTGDPFLAEISPITGPMYQLFVFFMIADPKSTVKSKKGQYLVAFLIAFVEFFFRLEEAIYAPFYALFVVGPIALLVEMWWNSRTEKLAVEHHENIT